MNKTIKMILLFGIAFLAISFSGCQMATSVDEPVDPYAHYYDEIREICKNATYVTNLNYYEYVGISNPGITGLNKDLSVTEMFELLKETDPMFWVQGSQLHSSEETLSVNSYIKYDGVDSFNRPTFYFMIRIK